MSKQNERDTQFVGFAAMLLREIDEAIGKAAIASDTTLESLSQILGAIIAQRAYDLVEHACQEISSEQVDGRLSVSGMLWCIPDMTEWPEEWI